MSRPREGRQTGATERIRELLAREPGLLSAEVARRLGCSPAIVCRVRAADRRGGGGPPKPSRGRVAAERRALVVAALERDPQRSLIEIAQEVGCSPQRVGQIRDEWMTPEPAPPSEPSGSSPPPCLPSLLPWAMRALACATERELALVESWSPELLAEARQLRVIRR